MVRRRPYNNLEKDLLERRKQQVYKFTGPALGVWGWQGGSLDREQASQEGVEAAKMRQKERPKPDTEFINTVTLNSQPPELTGINVCCSSHPVCGILLQKPQLTKEGRNPDLSGSHLVFSNAWTASYCFTQDMGLPFSQGGHRMQDVRGLKIQVDHQGNEVLFTCNPNHSTMLYSDHKNHTLFTKARRVFIIPETTGSEQAGTRL